MKHLNEDELLMSVFDDSDSLNLDELDEEQKKEFMALSGLKLDLKRLNDIPPCQLSSDRLRRRILEQGIQNQSKGRSGWFWFASAGAVSCACIAVSAVMIWNWYQPSPPVQSPALAMQTGATPTAGIEDIVREKPQPEVAVKKVNPPALEVASAPQRSHRRSPSRATQIRRPAGTTMTVAMAEPGTGYLTRTAEHKADPEVSPPITAADLAPLTAPENSTVPEAPKAAFPQPMGKSSPVVVISQSPNPQSPAVESSGHVVFGG